MSFLAGALGAAMPLLKWGGGYLLGKAKTGVDKLMNWAIPRLGGVADQGFGKSVKDWVMSKMDQSFGGMMDYANSYLMKNKVPIIAKTSTDAASAMRGRMGGGDTGGGGQADVPMDSIEK